MKRLIREWAASGEICRVLGRHFWRAVPHLTLEYRFDGNYPEHQNCEICGKSQSRVMGEWK